MKINKKREKVKKNEKMPEPNIRERVRRRYTEKKRD